MVACGLLFGGGMFLLGEVTELWQLFLAFGISCDELGGAVSL